MPFDLKTWKEDIKKQLSHLRESVQDYGIYSVYSFLATTTLWPVVQAFSSGDISALFALGNVLSGVGGGLLANNIQAWKDKADARELEKQIAEDPALREELRRELEKQIAENPALREELDTVMEELGTLELARSVLPDADRQWFVETLQQELAELGNLPRFEAVLGGVVVGGPVDKSVIVTGNNNSVTYIIHQYLGKDGKEEAAACLPEQIADYLEWTRERCGTIELRGIKREGEQVVQLPLEEVYVPLAASIAGRWFESFSMHKILEVGRRLIITGGPGSGKTTVLLHIAHVLASAIARDDRQMAWQRLGLKLEEKPRDKAGESEGLPLPIFVPLSAYADFLRNNSGADDPHKRTLAAFISHYLIEKQACFELSRDFFRRLLREGRGLILLLDGLDEVPDEDLRAEVIEDIEELLTGRHDKMRVIVTCRSAAYQGRTTLGRGFREVKVQPLEEEHVEQLVRQAYGHVYRKDEKLRREKTGELLDGIRKLEAERRQRFGEEAERLVTSPLLVRMLLIVHFSERKMPEQRAELYMKATDAMLKPDYAPEVEVENRIGRLVGGSLERHRDLVQHLAFAMHGRGEKRGRDISEDDLRRVLGENSVHRELVDDFIALTRLRGTLLEERDRIYRFIHLSFQEFLTARYLAEVVRGEAGVEGIVRFLEKDRVLESWWREPILLVAGYLTMTSLSTAALFLRRLPGLDDNAAARNKTLSGEVQVAAAELATAAFLEWPEAASDMRPSLQQRLNGLMTERKISPRMRVVAGNILAKLGDPRFREDAWYLPDDPADAGLGFVEIPAGPFKMGSDKKRDRDTIEDEECPQHTLELPTYYIARYPVTVAQFKVFVDVTGYEPKDRDCLRGVANHPVVWVSWHDALNYCDWLTETLRQWEGTPEPLARLLREENWRITLPSEAEWEKAARGADGRIYPWGDKPDPNKANYRDTGIGTTNPVGCFPGGASHPVPKLRDSGCQDMAGNVWEWTRSLWKDYPYPASREDQAERENLASSSLQVLRGGSWIDDAQSCRCAFRHHGTPTYRFDRDGFRLALVP